MGNCTSPAAINVADFPASPRGTNAEPDSLNLEIPGTIVRVGTIERVGSMMSRTSSSRIWSPSKPGGDGSMMSRTSSSRIWSPSKPGGEVIPPSPKISIFKEIPDWDLSADIGRDNSVLNKNSILSSSSQLNVDTKSCKYEDGIQGCSKASDEAARTSSLDTGIALKESTLVSAPSFRKHLFYADVLGELKHSPRARPYSDQPNRIGSSVGFDDKETREVHDGKRANMNRRYSVGEVMDMERQSTTRYTFSCKEDEMDFRKKMLINYVSVVDEFRKSKRHLVVEVPVINDNIPMENDIASRKKLTPRLVPPKLSPKNSPNQKPSFTGFSLMDDIEVDDLLANQDEIQADIMGDYMDADFDDDGAGNREVDVDQAVINSDVQTAATKASAASSKNSTSLASPDNIRGTENTMSVSPAAKGPDTKNDIQRKPNIPNLDVKTSSSSKNTEDKTHIQNVMNPLAVKKSVSKGALATNDRAPLSVLRDTNDSASAHPRTTGVVQSGRVASMKVMFDKTKDTTFEPESSTSARSSKSDRNAELRRHTDAEDADTWEDVPSKSVDDDDERSRFRKNSYATKQNPLVSPRRDNKNSPKNSARNSSGSPQGSPRTSSPGPPVDSTQRVNMSAPTNKCVSPALKMHSTKETSSTSTPASGKTAVKEAIGETEDRNQMDNAEVHAKPETAEVVDAETKSMLKVQDQTARSTPEDPEKAKKSARDFDKPEKRTSGNKAVLNRWNPSSSQKSTSEAPMMVKSPGLQNSGYQVQTASVTEGSELDSVCSPSRDKQTFEKERRRTSSGSKAVLNRWNPNGQQNQRPDAGIAPHTTSPGSSEKTSHDISSTEIEATNAEKSIHFQMALSPDISAGLEEIEVAIPVGGTNLGIQMLEIPDDERKVGSIASLIVHGFRNIRGGKCNPSQDAGIELGDIIVGVNGKYAPNTEKLYELVRTSKDSIILSVVRKKGCPNM